MELYAKDCELVIGLVSPIGVNLEDVESRLRSLLRQYGYEQNLIHLSKVAEEVFPPTNDGVPRSSASDEATRLDQAMQMGTDLRNKYKRGDLYALLAIDKISSERDTSPNGLPSPRDKTAHVIRSLKHTEEVETLRSVYGSGFFLLGVTASIEYRKHYLRDIKGVEDDEEIIRLISRDDKEKLPSGLGQQTRDVFQLADAFVITDDTESLSKQIGRILDLMFSKPVVPPTAEEYAMFMAYAASLRSADLSRQVGAVVVNESNDILATGANDVPKTGGGLYWPDDKDQRDYVKKHDFNQTEKEGILDEIVGCLGNDLDEDVRASFREKVSKSRIMDITEYGRAVHAEMECLMQSARNGIPIRGSKLYTTTYPCHNCAKHIVAAGIKEVIYIEPYPKSYAVKMHDDSICEGEGEGNQVRFRQFVGIGPRHFIDLFSMGLSSGRKIKRKESSKLANWSRSDSVLRIPMSPLSYLESEMMMVNELAQLIEGDSNGCDEKS